MQYQTTKIRAVKSYPTYQLHAESSSEKVSAEDIFKICILETLQWIRSRLESFEHIPEQLNMPSPEEYEQLKTESLYSFSIDAGFTIDVVYVRSKKIWSFSITEPDMGANIGTENERQPVFGRSFCTDISFRMMEKSVEIGIRTICSEPVDTSVDCEVFRPAIVKSLAKNPLVGLKEFFALNGQPVEVTTKAAAERLLMYVDIYEDSLPVVLVCSAGKKVCSNSKEKSHNYPAMADPQKILAEFDGIKSPDAFFSTNRFDPEIRKMNLKANISGIDLNIKKPLKRVEETGIMPERNIPERIAEKDSVVELENIDYSLIAHYSLGYAHVCFVSEQCIDLIRRKLSNNLNEGDIAVIYGGEIIKKYSYSSYCEEMICFQNELRQMITTLPKGRAFKYGKISFHTDARLLEIEEKRSESLNYEGRFSLLSVENDELKQKIKELEQLNNGKTVNSDEYRRALKKVRSLEEENEKLLLNQNSIAEKLEIVSAAYKSSANIIDFYKYKADFAARFPNYKDEVCDWIENELSDGILLSPNVKSEMKKYSGDMDIAMLCDGILYLYGYAKYRKGDIDSSTLELYAEKGKWQVEGCGAEALKVYKDDYSAFVNGKKYLMDMHIKYGVNPRLLIRVYFCWDESAKRVIIGHMPTHLATLKQNT